MTKPPLDKRDWIAGLEKGLAILEAFDDQHARMTPTQAAMRTGKKIRCGKRRRSRPRHPGPLVVHRGDARHRHGHPAGRQPDPGRPGHHAVDHRQAAQFGRGVMVEVGNKLIGQFADCVASQLTGTTVGGATLVDVENPDEIAAEITEPESFAAPAPAAVGAHRTPQVRSAQPVDLLETAGAPVLKRVIPVIIALIALFLLRKLLTKNPAAEPES